jgi:hypothetical protein
MTAGDKVAVEDVGAVEDPGRIDAIGRGIDLLRIKHPLTSIGLQAKKMLTSRSADWLNC